MKKQKTRICLLLLFIVIGIAMEPFLSSKVFINASTDNSTVPNTDRIMKDIKYLSSEDEFGPSTSYRMAGFQGEKKAADYIKNQFQNAGLSVYEQKLFLNKTEYKTEFKVEENKNKNLTDTYFDDETLEWIFEEMSEETTKQYTSTIELIYLNRGTKQDFINAGSSLKDKVAFIVVNESTDFQYLKTLSNDVCKGIMLYEEDKNDRENTLMVNSDKVNADTNKLKLLKIDCKTSPAAVELASKLASGQNATLSFSVRKEIKSFTSQNIIADTNEENRNKPTILFCAHYDSVDCNGANDNASGAATIIELSRVFKNINTGFNYKFIAFGAEEVGLLGSQEYVKRLTTEEKNHIKYVVNLDMIGSGSVVELYTLEILNSSSYKPADLAASACKKLGISFDKIEAGGGSDHEYFLKAGIPAVLITCTKGDNFFHTKEDTYDKIKPSDIQNVCNIIMNM